MKSNHRLKIQLKSRIKKKKKKATIVVDVYYM